MSDINHAAHALYEAFMASSRAVVFTGAGISTECGIPDFRSPTGIWTRMKPIQFHDYIADPEMRVEAWRRRIALDAEFDGVKPGRGHDAIARLVETGRIAHVITQNIDNLHQMSGVNEDRIIELHGNASYATCLSCAARYEIDWVMARFTPEETPPDCTSCGGIIKAATISFGQPMPEDEMARAHDATLGADLFVSIGSSLVVYPAAGFPMLARENGARLVIMNREPTELDTMAELVIAADIGDVMAAMMRHFAT